MFVLITLKQTVLIPPDKLHLPIQESVTDELNDQLANQVIVNVGLCITLYDIVHIGQSFLHHGDASSHTQVTFRFVVFRPFIGETIVGKIRSCSREGVHISIGFFDNILVPPEHLQEPYRFEEKEQLWIWEYHDADSGEKHDMKMEVGEKIRFKVKEEVFKDTSPSGPSGKTDTTTTTAAAEDRLKKAPYSLIGTCAEPGLGLVSWWK